MVLGETQIHAQVREALRRADARRRPGPRSRACSTRPSARAGACAAETALGAAPDAFVALGADLADESLGGLEGRDVVVVGAGQMAALAVKHLRRRGVGPVRILNRSLEHARALAERTNAAARRPRRPARGARARRPRRQRDRRRRHGRARGTPCDGDGARGGPARWCSSTSRCRATSIPRSPTLDGVTLIDIVALRDRLAERDEQTAGEIVRAHEIVAEEVRRYVVRRRGDALAPLITALRARGDEILQAELDRHASHLRDLTPDERAAVERSRAASSRSCCTTRSWR